MAEQERRQPYVFGSLVRAQRFDESLLGGSEWLAFEALQLPVAICCWMDDPAAGIGRVSSPLDLSQLHKLVDGSCDVTPIDVDARPGRPGSADRTDRAQ